MKPPSESMYLQPFELFVIKRIDLSAATNAISDVVQVVL
jgi:hypothetical protein